MVQFDPQMVAQMLMQPIQRATENLGGGPFGIGADAGGSYFVDPEVAARTGYGTAVAGTSFFPGAGIVDAAGGAVDITGQPLPSFSENIREGQFTDAGLQALGVAGDIATIAAPLTGGATALLGAMMKAPGAARKVTKATDVASDVAGIAKPTTLFEDLQGNPIPVNEDGTITVYHRTNSSVDDILESDGFFSKENTPEIFVSNKPDGQIVGYGENVIELKIDQKDLQLNDVFSDEAHFTVPIEKANKALSKIDQKGNIAKVEPPTETQPGIIAFHGSGADFDEFRLDKIGTGEGNQAFGYGLYFTDSEDIGKFYKNQILKTQNVEYKGKPIKFNNPDDRDILDKELIVQGLVRDRILGGKFNSQEAIDSVINQLEQTIENSYDLSQPLDVISQEGYNSLVADLDYAKTLKADDFNYQEGKLYKVAIQPKPEELLDYDKPLSEQPKNVQDFYKNFKNSELGKLANESLNGELDRVTNPTGERIYGYVVEGAAGKIFGDNPSRELVKQVQKNKDDYKLVTEELLKSNIKGLKFKSGQLSNIADSDATNFVIFDDKLINILEKYGIVGPVAVSATAAALRDDDGST